ncbi:MAG: type II toxin-antitoxin system VapC family toxin [Actinobacteria bacterium]|nr:type II toxin-antitoxin system VapC family toxin [Actinomycetota bacterium]
MTLVVDASIVVRLLLNQPADDVLRQQFSALRTVHAPQLIDAEVASAVRGLLLDGKIELTRATQMLDDFAALRITRHPMRPHLGRVIELRNNLTAYDAFHVALSETLRIALLTQDPKISRATGQHAKVHVYP